MKSWREKAIEYGTYFIIFLTPIMYFGPSRYITYTSSKTFFFYGAVEIVFALWLYQIFVDSSYRLSKKDLLWFLPYLSYILWLTIAGVFGPSLEMSFWSSLSRGTGLLTLFHLSALMVVVTSLVRKNGLKDYGDKLIKFFIGSSFVLTLSVWLGNEGFNLPFKFLEKSKGGGLMGNSSLTATVLVFALFLEIFLLLKKDSKIKEKVILVLSIAFIVFSPLFLSLFGAISARGAMLGLIVGLFSSLIFYLIFSNKKVAKVIGYTTLVLGISVFCFSWHKLMTSGTYLHDKFSQSAGENRFIFWEVANKAIKDRPVFGYGPENYRVAYQKYFDPKIYTNGTSIEIWNDRAHNIFFDTGVSGGVPAIAFYGLFLVSLLFGSYKAFKAEKMSRSQASFLCALVLAYVFQNLFVFDSLVSLLSLGVISAIIFGACAEPLNDKKNILKEKTFLAVIIFLLFIPIWIFFTWMPSRKTSVIANVIGLPLNKRSDHYADLLKGSVVGNAFEAGNIADDTYHLYSDNREKIKNDKKTLPYALKDLEKFISYAEELSKRETLDYHLYLNLAKLYVEYMYLADKDSDKSISDKAIDVAKKAINLSPNDPQGYWTLAVIYYRSGDIATARKIAEKAIEIAPYIQFSKDLLVKIK